MLKLTLEKIDTFKRWPDEINAMKKILKYCKNKWIEVYLFGSRLYWMGIDIDLILKGNVTNEDLKKLQRIAFLETDTKIDFVVDNKKNKKFIQFVETSFKS